MKSLLRDVNMRTCKSDNADFVMGPQLYHKKNLFEAYIFPSRTKSEFHAVQKTLCQRNRFQRFHHRQRVARIRVEPDTQIVEESMQICEKDRLSCCAKDSAAARSSCDLNEVGRESCQIWEVAVDDERGLTGAADRLLHLLQRWEIDNITLVTCHLDGSLSERVLDGFEVYQDILKCAKRALEEYYITRLDVVSSAKLEIAIAPIVTCTKEESSPKAKLAVGSFLLKQIPTLSPVPCTQQRTQTAVMKSRPSKAALVRRKTLNSLNQFFDLLGITRQEWFVLMSAQQKTRENHLLLICLVCIADSALIPEQWSSRPESAMIITSFDEKLLANVPSALKWLQCIKYLPTPAACSALLKRSHGAKLLSSQAECIRATLQDPSINTEAQGESCMVGGKIKNWLHNLINQYDASIFEMSTLELNDTNDAQYKCNASYTQDALSKSSSQADQSQMLSNQNYGEKVENVKNLTLQTRINDTGRLLKKH